MKTLILSIALFSSTAFAKDFGKGIQSTEKPITLTEAIAKIDTLKEKEIVVKSTVGMVCQAKGCWMMLEDGKEKIRVTFNNYSFFVPKDSGKKTATVQGKIYWKDVTAGEARHYAKDEGKPLTEVAMAKGTKTPWFEATGVRLE